MGITRASSQAQTEVRADAGKQVDYERINAFEKVKE